MEVENRQRTLPAIAAIVLITLFVLLSISGYLILSAS